MKLVIRADDFGYSNSVNEGILDAVSSGLLCEVGLMINMPYVTYKIEELKASGVHLGLHTNISIGHPVMDAVKVSSLVNDTMCFHSSNYIRECKDLVLDKEQLQFEIEAQIEKFKEIVGYYPTYIDVHAVLHPDFMAMVKQVAKDKNYLYIDTPLCEQEICINNTNCSFVISPTSISKTCELVQGMMTSKYGILVLHPGYVDDVLQKTSSVVCERVNDVELLTKGMLKNVLDTHHIERIYFEDISPT